MENSFESDPRKEIVNQQDIDAFVTDLKEYDREHSQGAFLGKFMATWVSDVVKNDVEDESEGNTESIEEKLQKDIEQKLSIDDLMNIHSSLLEKIGLSIHEPAKAESDVGSKSYAIGESLIHIDNMDKFLIFIRSIGSERVDDSTNTLLDIVGKKIVAQIQKEYDLENFDDRFIDLYSSIDQIASEYERIGKSDFASNMREYMKYGKLRCLKEYVLAKNKGFFEPIGKGFNMSTFQHDSTYESYKKYWDERAFGVLEIIKGNDSAGELYKDAVDYLVECVRFAENDKALLDRKTESSEKLIKAVKEVKEKLTHYV